MNLRQHLLLAMPHQEGFFENAVVVLCEHDEAGALGFVVNKPIKTDLAHILKEVQQDFDEDDEQTSIYAGAPSKPSVDLSCRQRRLAKAHRPLNTFISPGTPVI